MQLITAIQYCDKLSHNAFKCNQLALLGYSWVENKLEIYLLHLDSHENFYQKLKSQRKTDLKFIDS
ncbi:type II toxin-antitoxin system RelE/ParE family toxin [Vibrio agarivorans]|nr:type II toxin-antitoxin system RelE/ParE family toxin [Vibrio agarivorans]MDN3663262.1 type II toxin-antitoxin system RelE/ParE family toxin [Vibrio agarivorans]